MSRQVALVVCCIYAILAATSVTSFTPSSLISRSTVATFQTTTSATTTILTQPPAFLNNNRKLKLSMVDEKSETTTEGQKSTEVVPPVSGTYYDDEVEPVEKVGISETMKERLLREASTGLDPDKKNTNVILYIIAGVSILVLLGGQGILY